MPRFFVPYTVSVQETEIAIADADGRHIRDVLRMKTGEELTVCDAHGTDHQCRIDSIGKEAVTVRILSREQPDNESPYEIVLYQGLPKADKMELIIQKFVELGGSRIVPVACTRSVTRLGEVKEIEKKLLRWNKIAYEAAKQSNRNMIPSVGMPVPFKEAIRRMSDADIAFIPWECEEENGIKEILAGKKKLSAETAGKPAHSGKKPVIAFIIGPEGGFDQEEISFAKECGILTVTLGKRVLRTETAALAILSMILYEMEL
jgi:16S rRNA (uracil1498-N3)-methyltransferase